MIRSLAASLALALLSGCSSFAIIGLPSPVRVDDGDSGAELTVVHAQRLVVRLPHKAEALEDTLDVDIFSPPRQDWLDKTDDYLRGR